MDGGRCGRAITLLWVGFVLSLVAGCAPDSAQRGNGGEASSVLVRSDLYDLTGIPLSSDLAPAVLAARATLDQPDRPSRFKKQIERYERLDQDFSRPGAREAAEDSLLVWWAADPQNFLWIRTAALNHRDLRRQDELERIKAHPALTDTTRGAGAFLAGVWSSHVRTAARHYARARAAWADLDSLQRAFLMLEIGRNLRRAGRPLEGVATILDHLLLMRRVGGPQFEAYVWGNLTSSLTQADRLDDATHAAVTSWELARVAGDAGQEASAREDLATILAARREYRAARELYEENVALCREHGFPGALQMTLDRLASLMTTTGDFAAALAYDHRILDLLEASGRGHNLPGVLMNIANDHLYLSQPDSARLYMERSLIAAEAYGSSRIQGAMMQRAAVYLTHFGEYELAEERLREANALLAESGQTADMLHLQVEALREAVKMGQIDLAYEALRWLGEYDGDILNRSPNENLEAQIEIASADLYRHQGEYRRAAEALERARAAIDRRPGAEWAWEYERSVGRLAAAREDFEGAAEAFDRCVSIAREVDNDDWLDTSWSDLARALLATGRYEEARKAIPPVESGKRFGTRFRTRLETHVLRGAALRLAGEMQEAERELSTGTDLLTPHSPPDLAARLRVEYAHWLAERGRPEAAAQMCIEALSGLDRRPEYRGSAAGDKPRRDALELLIGLYRRHPSLVPGRDVFAQTLSLMERYWWVPAGGLTASGPGTVEEIATEHPARSRVEDLVRSEAAGAVSGHCTLVAYLVGEKTSYRWIAGPGIAEPGIAGPGVAESGVAGSGVAELEALPGRQELLEQLTPILQDMRTPGRPPDLVALRSLSRLLLGPVTEYWPLHTTLYVIPDELLYQFPWVVSVIGGWTPDADPSFLCDHGPVTQLTSLLTSSPPPAASDAPVSVGRAGSAFLGIGHNGTVSESDATGAGPRLRHAEAEVTAIGKLWPEGAAHVLVGDQARWQVVRGLVEQKTDVIHLATHAVVYQSSRDQASIRLAGEDGEAVPVTLQALRDLSLSAQLVFLSCCEAAARSSMRGKQSDFAHAFLAAGAETVIASTQRVDDEAARFLALRFYGHWLNGTDPSEALRRAQIETREHRPEWKHPYYWAAYRAIRSWLRQPTVRQG